MKECLKAQQKDMGLVKSSKESVIFSKVHDSLIRTAYNMFKDQPLFLAMVQKCLE
jgi:hypothetical protein